MKEKIAAIKRDFMAYRNGIVADTLRKAGMPYSLIFGLQLPQLSAIARSNGMPDRELARGLWQDRNVRESRLLACWLFDAEKTDIEQALELARDIRTREEGDILAFRLLRRLPFAEDLARQLGAEPEDSLPYYCATALRRNLENS